MKDKMRKWDLLKCKVRRLADAAQKPVLPGQFRKDESDIDLETLNRPQWRVPRPPKPMQQSSGENTNQSTSLKLRPVTKPKFMPPPQYESPTKILGALPLDNLYTLNTDQDDRIIEKVICDLEKKGGEQESAQVQQEVHETQEAIAPAQETLETLSQNADAEAITAIRNAALAHYHLGVVRSPDDPQAALTSYRKAVEIDADLTDGWAQMGRLLLQIGQKDLAKEALENAVKAKQEDADRALLADAHLHLSALCAAQSDNEAAQTYLKQALELEGSIGRVERLAMGHANLGLLILAAGNLSEAEDHLKRALNFDKEAGHLEGMADLCANLALISLTQGELGTAEHYFRESLSLTQKLDDKEDVGNSLCGLGLIAHMRHDMPEASRHWQESRALFQQSGAVKQLKIVERLMDAAV